MCLVGIWVLVPSVCSPLCVLRPALFRVVSVRDPIAQISHTPSISRTLQIPPPTHEAQMKNPVATHRGAHRPDALTTIKAPATSMRLGPLRRPKVSPRSQHRFGFRSPPRLKLTTSSSRPLPPDALSIRPALAFQVPIRLLSHGCSAVWRSWISRSPHSISCPSSVFTLRTLSLSSHIRQTPSFFSSRSVLCHDADDPFPPAPRCRSGHHVPSSVVCTSLDTVPVAIPVSVYKPCSSYP